MALTGRKGGMEKMRICIRGNDRGNALLVALTFIVVFSYLFVSSVPGIINLGRMAAAYKGNVLREIQESNREIRLYYDLN